MGVDAVTDKFAIFGRSEFNKLVHTPIGKLQ